MNLDQNFIPYTKTDSKWMTNLNVNHNTIKLLEKEIRENLRDLMPGKQFRDFDTKSTIYERKN